MLLLLTADPRRDPDRCADGLLLALNSRRSEILDEVRVLLYGGGVWVLDPEVDEEDRFADLLRRLIGEGVEVVACSGNLLKAGLGAAARRSGVPPAGAQVYLSARIAEGASVVTY